MSFVVDLTDLYNSLSAKLGKDGFIGFLTK